MGHPAGDVVPAAHTWHGLATLALLPCFVIGLGLTYRDLPGPRSIGCLWKKRLPWPARTSADRGQWLMLATGFGLFAAGCTITTVGMTVVFVPQDLDYMRTTAAVLNAINRHLIPLIAHDRAGFGSGVLNIGFLIFAVTWCARPSRSRWQAMAVAGTAGFGMAIGVHPMVGYNNPVHLGPAIAGAGCFFAALWMMRLPLTSAGHPSSAGDGHFERAVVAGRD